MPKREGIEASEACTECGSPPPPVPFQCVTAKAVLTCACGHTWHVWNPHIEHPFYKTPKPC